ncbi:hypothetical protein PAXINDRAFT_16423 [Paxillus involutus ATCC 200175]|uniref:Uncharacterized protein n=1 Tax=Paxillus involutus ATCC 200175 TaxID=664439 RepID=A0A0C9TIM7_PAXIN|nr:hypothetical protein PAXINDRAFT_16423 [Paxillus involutus ATCC 200175]
METTPKTLDNWIAKAEHFNVQNEQIRSLKRGTPFQTNYLSNSSRNRDSNAMDDSASSVENTDTAPVNTRKERSPLIKIPELLLLTSNLISIFMAGLKKNISQKEILDVLKTCFDSDSEEDGTKEEQVPISKVSLESSF